MSMQVSPIDFLTPRGSPLSTIWGSDRNNFTSSPMQPGTSEVDFPAVGPDIPTGEDSASMFDPEDNVPEEVGEEAIETGEIAGETALDIVDPLMIVGQVAQATGNAISGAEDQSMMVQARNDYTNAMTNGHGIGYQSIAEQNLNNAQNAVGQHSTLTTALQAFGPAGALISALIGPSAFQSSPVTSYMAPTTSGNMEDTQDPSVINTT
uniref:Uncharacterized protein n=1 Tax=Apple picorna-like virus 1 TaxID=2709736 RepID=A0A6C0X1A6_9VIRU|nr:MAG: hypothetical protein [Apple picorna-like virus 1]